MYTLFYLSLECSFYSHPLFKVRPIQADANRNTTNARPTRWIPAEVWQRQGMTAQVLTLPGGMHNNGPFYFLCSMAIENSNEMIHFFGIYFRCCNSN